MYKIMNICIKTAAKSIVAAFLYSFWMYNIKIKNNWNKFAKSY
jgi:hypothetical protein